MKKFLALIMALALCLSLAACGGDTGSGDSGSGDTQQSGDSGSGDSGSGDGTFEPMTWKYACSATENTCWADMGRDFGQMVNEATGGAITVDVYAADQLTAGNQTEGIQGVVDGTIDLSAHSNIIYSSFEPKLNVVSLPFLFSSFDDVDAKLDGAAGQAVGEVVEGMGLHLLGIAENGFRHVTNSVHPIEKMADMKGLKIRVAGSDLLGAAYTKWGANWTNANWSEVYTGLQTGTYDGQENPLAIILTAKVYEVQKHVSMIDLFYSPCVLMISEDVYNGFTDEQKEAFDKAAEDGKTAERQISQDIKNNAREAMEAEGVTFTDVDKAVWVEAVQSVYSDSSLGIDEELLGQIRSITGN